LINGLVKRHENERFVAVNQVVFLADEGSVQDVDNVREGVGLALGE